MDLRSGRFRAGRSGYVGPWTPLAEIVNIERQGIKRRENAPFHLVAVSYMLCQLVVNVLLAEGFES